MSLDRRGIGLSVDVPAAGEPEAYAAPEVACCIGTAAFKVIEPGQVALVTSPRVRQCVIDVEGGRLCGPRVGPDVSCESDLQQPVAFSARRGFPDLGAGGD